VADPDSLSSDIAIEVSIWAGFCSIGLLYYASSF